MGRAFVHAARAPVPHPYQDLKLDRVQRDIANGHVSIVHSARGRAQRPPAISDPTEPDNCGEHCELRVPNCAVSAAYKAGRLFDRIVARTGAGDKAIVVAKDMPIENDTDRETAGNRTLTLMLAEIETSRTCCLSPSRLLRPQLPTISAVSLHDRVRMLLMESG